MLIWHVSYCVQDVMQGIHLMFFKFGHIVHLGSISAVSTCDDLGYIFTVTRGL